MLSRLYWAPSSKSLSKWISQPCRTFAHWDKRVVDNYKPLRNNKADVLSDPNYPYKFDNYHPDGIYYRLYIHKSGPREWGKFRMDFSGYEKALAVCQGGMVNVATLPARSGEFVDPAPAPPKYEKGSWWEKLEQEKDWEKWRWYHPKMLPTDNDRPPSFFSMNQALYDVMPGTNQKWADAWKVWKKEGRDQAKLIFSRFYLKLNSRYQMWYHEGGFDQEKFLQDALNTYVLAHQAARDKKYDMLKDVALELECGRLTKRFGHYRQLWRCWSVTEKPTIIGRYCLRLETFGNALVAQVFVRIKTREEHVAYSRTGERLDGVEGKQVDLDQVLILERMIEGGGTLTRCWRILEIVPASDMESWKATRHLSEV
ncbi:uncharacterized protein LOC135822601 [Sycon ciliatum]|uniref:uncharacterized protein LOC135822601 n=1 Tax=Sycon ciliatum TaxID=27933 RepID=UPI0020AC8161|eukprot:scpid60179/ scgid19702/ 